MEFSARRT